jgi:hypothetical protein
MTQSNQNCFGTLKIMLILLLLILIATPAFSANYYVRKGATGLNNGSNWTNAWNEMNQISWGSISPGDSIWIAGGNYTTRLAPTTSGTSGNRISIRRARADATECTGATGWSPSYDSLIYSASMDGHIVIGSISYVTFSGRTSADGGGYGWKIDNSAVSAGNGVSFAHGANSSNLTFEYMELAGKGGPVTGDMRAFDVTPSGGSQGYNLFSHLYVHNWESGWYDTDGGHNTLEYCDISGIENDGTGWHSNLYFMWGSNYNTFRYNRIHGRTGEGIFCNDSNIQTYYGIHIYGNVFYDVTDNKCIQMGLGNDTRIYNNTFDNCTSGYVYSGTGYGCTNCETRNNIYRGSGGPWINSGWGTKSNNLETTNTGIFVNQPNKDFHIVSTVASGYPRNAGYNVGSPYNIDPDGVTRGADGAWDIGAYEYTGSGNLPPQAPKNLSISPN